MGTDGYCNSLALSSAEWEAHLFHKGFKHHTKQANPKISLPCSMAAELTRVNTAHVQQHELKAIGLKKPNDLDKSADFNESIENRWSLNLFICLQPLNEIEVNF